MGSSHKIPTVTVSSPPIPKGSGYALAIEPLADLVKPRQRAWCKFEAQPIERDYSLRYIVLSFQGVEVRGAPVNQFVIRVNVIDTAGSCRFYNSGITESDVFRIHDGTKCFGLIAEPGINYIPAVESIEHYPVRVSGRTVTNLRIFLCEPDILSKPNVGLLIEVLEAPLPDASEKGRGRIGWTFLPFSGKVTKKHRLVLNRYLFRPPGASSASKVTVQVEDEVTREYRAPLAAFELASNFPEISPSAVYLEISEVAELPPTSAPSPAVVKKSEISGKTGAEFFDSFAIPSDPKLCVAPPSGNFLNFFPENLGGFSRLSFSPSGKLLAAASRVVGNTFHVHVIDLEMKTELQSINGHSGEITDVQWFDEKTLATSGVDGLVKIWSLYSAAPALILSHPGPVTTLHAHSSGDLLAATVPGFGVKLWQGADGVVFAESTQHGYSLCARFAPTNSSWMFIGTSRGFILLADHARKTILTAYSLTDLTALGVALHDIQPAEEAARLRTGAIAMLLVSSKDSVLRLVALPAPEAPTVVIKSVSDFRGATCNKMDIRASISADGRLVASGSECGNLFVWDTASGKRRTPIESGHNVSLPFAIFDAKWSRSHRFLAVASHQEDSDLSVPLVVEFSATEAATAEVIAPALNTGWHQKWTEKEHALGNNIAMKLKAQIIAEITGAAAAKSN